MGCQNQQPAKQEYVKRWLQGQTRDWQGTTETSAWREMISANAAELRLAWRSAAQFDDIAVMHITRHGVPMLTALAVCAGIDSSQRLRDLLSSPPWTGNEGSADVPLSLLVALRTALMEFAGDDSSLSAEVEQLTNAMAATIDSVQREKVGTLEERVATDTLTGSLSRSTVLDLLAAECARSVRYGRPLSVVYIDVDHLKQVNDENGHAAGDDLLQTLARNVMSNTRAADHFGRVGGDEFLLVLPETDLNGAERAAAKTRELLANAGVSVTCGTAGTPQTGLQPDELVAAADADLRSTRNAERR